MVILKSWILNTSLVILLWMTQVSDGVCAEQSGPLLLRDPSISATHIAFAYAGYIWIADRDGKNAHSLTSSGHDGKPALSPDGSQVAFARDLDGEHAVYVVPTAGGEPRRLTYHPADLGAGAIPDVVAWTPDGQRVVFNSRRAAYTWWEGKPGNLQLFSVSSNGGLPVQVPIDGAAQASYSVDLTRAAYVSNIQWEPAWKHYRGGQTTAIRIARLTDSEVQAEISRDNSNDFNPMWVANTIYFLSDRNGPVTLFAYDLKSRQVREVVKNSGFDIKSAAATADAIVYEQFGSLHLLTLTTGVDRELDIHPVAEFAAVRPHMEKIDPARIRSAELSPTGDLAVFGGRGEILTVARETGAVRNLTRTTNAVERDPSWSPDGNSIAYFSDASGEYALHVREPERQGKVLKISLGSHPSFYNSPTWAPNSRMIAYTDNHLNYWYVDLAKKRPVRVGQDPYLDFDHRRQLVWSPDSRWLAYARQLPSHVHAIFIYSLEQSKEYQLTDGMSDALHVAFDESGRYLYFTASTDVALSRSKLEMSSLHRPVTRSVYIIALTKAYASPLLPHGSEGGATVADDRSRSDRGRLEKVDIDFDDIAHRIQPLPVAARNYYDLRAGKSGVIFLVEGPQFDPMESLNSAWGLGTPTKIQRFDLKTQTTVQLQDDVVAFYDNLFCSGSFRLSFNGEKMMYFKQGQWFITSTERVSNLSPVEPEAPLELNGLSVYVEPRSEWAHIYEQVWRDEREFFYDPNLHGVNLDAISRRYQPFVKNLSSRGDLTYLLTEMLGNIGAGHIGASDAESSGPEQPKTGLLGAEYVVDHGRYRFAHIYKGDPWDPEARPPLVQFNERTSVSAGEYLLAVDGHAVRPDVDVHYFFAGTAGKRVSLTVGPQADGVGSREVEVVPVEDETSLRNHAWVENNRRKVGEMSHGKVAYVYLPNTGLDGYSDFNREYFAQVGKDAVIIDERYNGGGLVADYIVDNLRRPLMNYWDARDAEAVTTPQEMIFGPKVMIVNEMSGSGGDALPWMFRRSGLGPLIGKRTWGGLIGTLSWANDLLDGSSVATPNYAFYNPDGAWDIENHGVRPDFEVDNDPKSVRVGHDPQLEKAVSVIMDLLQKHPAPTVPHRPPYPDYQTSAR